MAYMNIVLLFTVYSPSATANNAFTDIKTNHLIVLMCTLHQMMVDLKSIK